MTFLKLITALTILEFEVNFLRLVDKLTNGTNLDVNETGTDLYFQPGLLVGGVIDHECCKLRGIGYYLELIIMIAPYCKKGIQATLKGVTNNQVNYKICLYIQLKVQIFTYF